MVLVERPGYRIDSRTIKRGSRPSILIVSFMESSNLCIHASLLSSLLLLIWLLSWCGLGACRARHDKTKFTENGFRIRLLLRFRFWRFCRFIRVEDLYLPFLCKIFIACLPFPRVAFVVLFPTKLVLLHSDFNCKRYGFLVGKKEF